MKTMVMCETIAEAEERAKSNDGRLYVAQNWECEGALWMYGDTTIKTYIDLKDKQSRGGSEGIFFAFDKGQFREGLVKLGFDASGISDDDLTSFAKGKIYSIGCCGYGTKEGIKNYLSFLSNIDKEIAEKCDPLEVYIYEYNNHESMINYDGDEAAIHIVKDLFGIEVARQIPRRSAYCEI